jgi:hypothetical protein
VLKSVTFPGDAGVVTRIRLRRFATT